MFKHIRNSKALSGACIIILLWYVLHLVVQSNIIPGPYETIIAFTKLMTKDLPLHIIVSLYRITTSIGVSLGIGVPLGFDTKTLDFVSCWGHLEQEQNSSRN